MSQLITLLLFLVCTTAAYAQVQAGRIVGSIFDPAKALVPGATITVTETGTGQKREVKANDAGAYVVTPLNAGVYEISVSASGFRTTVRSNVEMRVGQDLRVDFELSIGEAATRVEVTAEVPLLNSESGNVGHVMTNRQIVDLPLNGRGFNELARLTPGVVITPPTGSVNRIRPEFFNGTTMSGVRGRQVSFYLDGSDTSEQHQGGSWVQTSIDALQEFSVQQNAYSAEHSRSGSFYNAVTKSGSNEIRGTLFEFLRNEKLDARNFFLKDREVLKRNQFGASVGGPVYIPKVYNGKNKTFFFVTWEGMRERTGLVNNRTAPTAAMLNGDFSAPGLFTIYDPMTTVGNVRQPFAGNRIPADRLSAQAKFFNPYIPTVGAPGQTFSFAPSRVLDEDQLTLKGDQSINDNNKVFVRWSWHTNRLGEPGNVPALGLADLKTHGYNITGSWTSNFKPTVINEARFNMLSGIIDLKAYLQGRDFNKEAGIRGFDETKRSYDVGSFPDFNWSGYTNLTGSSFDQRPKTQDRDAREFLDNLTWIKGSHVFKFGGKVRYYRWLGTDSKSYVGNWTFNGTGTENPAAPTRTGDSFADWMLGVPSNGARGVASDTFGGDSTAWHLYYQDDWKVSQKLTLNFGIRYEYTPWQSGYRGQTGTFDATQAKPIIVASKTDTPDLDAQPAAKTAYGYLSSLIQTSSTAGLPYSITYPDKKQWAPRFGFAWRALGDKTVVRGGYGIFYETEYSDRRVNLFMPPFLLEDSALYDRGTVPRRFLNDFYLGAALGSPNSIIGLTPSYTRLRMGYDQHWNLGVQQQLTNTMLIEVQYVANKGSFLAGNNLYNAPEPGPGAVQQRRPLPRFGGFSYLSQDVSSTYHALQTKFEKRLTHGLWNLTSYSWSNSMWAEQTPSKGGRYAFDRFPSEFHVPHNFATSFGYELPFGKGKALAGNAGRAADAVVGGWQMQGIFVFRSSNPFTVTTSRDIANTGIGSQRPNRIASGKSDNPTLEKWFDTSAFVLANQYTYGNSGIRILSSDIQRTIDFSMFKNFKFGERQRLQFRWEVFNLPNTPSFAAPNSTIDSATVGRITATSTSPRQMQVALKFYF